MIGFITGALGLIVGFMAAWSIGVKRYQSVQADLLKTRGEVDLANAKLEEAAQQEQRRREEQTQLFELMEQKFENSANRAIQVQAAALQRQQDELQALRESKLDTKLVPLEKLLDDYQKNLNTFATDNNQALSDVKARAEELLRQTQQAQAETQRLNQLLGRSSERGAWGEIQLANVLHASGLRENIDFRLQVQGVNSDGTRVIPDCVVNMPNGGHLIVDAKFPFASFEASLRTEDPDERVQLRKDHATALRLHVKQLTKKGYFESQPFTPEYTIAFVPSEAAIAAAFEADPSLHADAAKDRVLIVGPTTLLSLLWSVAQIVQQHELALNAQQIANDAQTLFDRIRNVAEPIKDMGVALKKSNEKYNDMLRSFESRLIPLARRMSEHGVAKGVKELPELGPVEVLPHQIDDVTWGVDGENALPEGSSEILDL